MKWGKQHRFCPNCGKHMYDEKLTTTHVLSLMCDKECRDEWERKYASMVLGHDAPQGGV